ncbi:MAG TPA: hypothetical protein VIY28_01355 [Pseudonocardiaceae bacterium]
MDWADLSPESRQKDIDTPFRRSSGSRAVPPPPACDRRHLVWFATRRRTQLGYLAGVGVGIYQAAGLGLVSDYGVADPKRPLGRAATVMWTIVGVCSSRCSPQPSPAS